MKNFKFLLLALPLFVASCTNDEDFSEVANTGDPYAGIKKVNAVFASDMVQGQGLQTRMATQFGLEANDKIGLAWLGYYDDATHKLGVEKVDVLDDNEVPVLDDEGQPTYTYEFDGTAYQNHPLIVTPVDGGALLRPQTSIYVGHYFSYYPYDAATVKPGAINFDLSEQPLVTESMNGAAAKAIYISRKNTEVTASGTPVSGTTYDKAGVDEIFRIYPQQFSNLNKIAATYANNEPKDKNNNSLMPVEIKKIKVAFKNSLDNLNNVTGLTYEPTAQVDGNGSNLWTGDGYPAGVTFNPAGYYTLKEEDPNKRLSTAGEKTAKFYFNSLPAAVQANATDKVEILVYTNYGELKVSEPINSCFKTAKRAGTTVSLCTKCDGADVSGNETAVEIDKSAVNTLGNAGNVIDVKFDFSKSNINNMEIESDAELMNILKFYQTLSSPGTKNLNIIGTGSGTKKEFVMSVETAKLLATINASTGSNHVKLSPAANTTIVLKNNGTTAEEAEEMPKLNFFGGTANTIALRGSWKMGKTQGGENPTAANVINYYDVEKFINYGTITFDNSVVDNVAHTTIIENQPGAKINVNGSVELDMNINNLGTIDIPVGSELLVGVGSTLTNDATALNAFGTIYNKGTLGRIDGTNPSPAVIKNYGVIDRTGAASNSKTLITSNAIDDGTFSSGFNKNNNKIGTIILNGKTDGQYVSIQNSDKDGFIKLTVDKETINNTNTNNDLGTKANYIVVGPSNKFFNVGDNTQLKYVEFQNAQETVWTSNSDSEWDGVIVKSGSTVTIPAGSTVKCKNAMIKGRVYKAGTFVVTSHSTYLGPGDQKNIVTM